MGKLLIYIGILLVSLPAISQTVTTAVPFLDINPDVRSAALGNTGVASSPDVWSAFTNPARYAFAKERAGVAFSYLPWMKHMVDGQHLFALAGYYQVDENSAISLGARYFTFPDFIFTDEEGEITGKTSPADWALDVAYSRRFGGHWSLAFALRYIHSGIGDEAEGMDKLKDDGAIAGDLSVYYVSAMQFSGGEGHWRAGLQIANVGSKISAYGAEAYLPATLKLGGVADLMIDGKHGVMLAVEFSRLLVEGNSAFKDNSVLANIAGSFSNRALLKSVVWKVGAEYDFRGMVAGRIGYHHESEMYGDRTYFTLGAGGKYAGFSLDAAYLFPCGDSDAPYKNTWRIGIGYCF